MAQLCNIYFRVIREKQHDRYFMVQCFGHIKTFGCMNMIAFDNESGFLTKFLLLSVILFVPVKSRYRIPDIAVRGVSVKAVLIIIIITSLFIEDYILSTCKYLSNIWSS